MKLDDIAGKIRNQHGDVLADSASSDRITYASFPASLKTAMKAAANRNGWCRESWRLQTAMIQEAMLSGYDVDTLAAGYQEAVHG